MNKYENMYAADYRRIAAEKCQKYSGRLALIYFIYSIICSVGSLFTLKTIQINQYVSFQVNLSPLSQLLLTGPFMFSLVQISKKVFIGDKEPEVEELFGGFKKFGDNFVLYLLQSVYIFFWTLLFVIPGIVKSYAYSMTFFIKEENPELPSDLCITRSKELMQGHKFELFCLDLSYIGWLLLVVLTFGILSFWVVPKMQMAHYIFYRNITGRDVTNSCNAKIDVIDYEIDLQE